jgi:aminoglycoside phosphotransferase (APT) family kinase protein
MWVACKSERKTQKIPEAVLIAMMFDMEEKIRQLIKSELGEIPLRVEHMSFGHGSETFDVELRDRHVMLRTNIKADTYRGTSRNIQVLGKLGLPVPLIIAENDDPTEYGFVFMLLAKIPGRDLRFEIPSMSHSQLDAVAKKVVEFERKAETLPEGDSFGYAPIGVKAHSASWPDMLNAEMASKQPQDDYSFALAEKIDGYLRVMEPRLAKVRPTCFLDDLTTKNVIVLAGNLQGVIDFDVVCYGDPLWWLSLAAVAVLSDLGVERFYYVDRLRKLWGIDGTNRHILALYETIHGLDFLIRYSAMESESWMNSMRGYVNKNTQLIDQYLTNEPK